MYKNSENNMKWKFNFNGPFFLLGVCALFTKILSSWGKMKLLVNSLWLKRRKQKREKSEVPLHRVAKEFRN